MGTRPVDLIVANVMHDAVGQKSGAEDLMHRLAKALKAEGMKNVPPVPKLELDPHEVARTLLCRIAHDASIKVVFSALKAASAPCSSSDITEGIQAVLDGQVRRS
jgi:negative regulator of sigma E activity